ncbi:anti-sigma factor [Shewanella sp. AC34-MNA-CIBAN-0136]|uniref:anti-sigma factor n=1 Tax=Shewanella sp. AC34-MNA-CIBAN-0136 TaxID=3140463 RepID=UPI00332991FD
MNTSPQDLDSLIKSLPLEMQPTTDLWPAIAAKLPPQSQQKKHLTRPWLIAASVAVFCMLTILLWQRPEGNSLLPQTAALTTTTPQATVNTEVSLTTSSTQTEATLAELVDQIAMTHQTQLDVFNQNQYTVSWQLSSTDAPQQIQSDISQALAELDTASKQVQAALKQQPTNQQMWQLWRWIMQRQITLLQQGQKLPFTSKRTPQGNTI